MDALGDARTDRNIEVDARFRLHPLFANDAGNLGSLFGRKFRAGACLPCRGLRSGFRMLAVRPAFGTATLRILIVLVLVLVVFGRGIFHPIAFLMIVRGPPLIHFVGLRVLSILV